MTGLIWSHKSWLVAFVLAGMTISGQAFADESEVRDFTVQVDGKQVGHTQLVITQRKDGTTLVENKAHVQVKFIITYTYTYQGSELWHNYQLLNLNGQCNDNLKKYTVQAEYDAKNKLIRVQAQNKEQNASPEVWTTSYWRLPEAKFHNKAVPLLDADRGDLIGGQLQYVATEELNIAGQKQKCYHFRVTGPNPPVDLWFDVYHRLVRQEFIERGHRTVIELVGLKR